MKSILFAILQAQTASQILQNTQSQLTQSAAPIVNIVSIAMGLVGAVMLGINLVKYAKGDPSTNDTLMKVGIGLLIAVIILQVIRVSFLQGV